jgi:hypothetical protein
MAKYDDVDPGLPIKLGPVSNGEFLPPPASPLVKETQRRAYDLAERNARRLGMSRRRFLLSTMGAASTLGVLAACSKEENAANGTGNGGTFSVPDEAALDADAAADVLNGKQYIFDVQTHFLDANHDIPDLGTSEFFNNPECEDGDARDCFSVDWYLDLLFNQSATNMVVISALPWAGSPLNPDVMKGTIELADQLGCGGHVLMQGEGHPSMGSLDQALDNMSQLSATLPIGAWKTYTHQGGPGWTFDDHNPDDPQVGVAFIERALELGPNIIAVHKGLGGLGATEYAHPRDIGPSAARFPDMNFVIYHSGFDTGPVEGPYDPDNDNGVDRLITTAMQNGIGPGGNIYPEIGSTWRILMGQPDAAAHVIGKLLNAFGSENLCWGTDSIWYGSPQDQIDAFRTFQITPEFQDQYGYPELTDDIKANIFGLNSSRLYGVDPITDECHFDRDEIIDTQLTAFGNKTLGPTTADGAVKLAKSELAELARLF